MKDVGNGGGSVFDGSAGDAGECGERLGSALVLGTVGDFSGDYRRPQGPFRAIIGGLHLGFVEEVQNPLPVMLESDSVQETLVIGIA